MLYRMGPGGADVIRSELIGELFMFPINVVSCSLCARHYETRGKSPTFSYTQGKRVPDFLTARHAGFLCVTERVVSDLEKHNIQGWTAIPTAFDLVPKRLKLPPLYALGVDNHWVKPDLAACGLADSEFCKECYKFITELKEPTSLVIDESSIDYALSDFFHMRPLAQVYMLVTERVVEVARKERWTNVRFQYVDNLHKLRGRRELRHLSDDWPPPGWGAQTVDPE